MVQAHEPWSNPSCPGRREKIDLKFLFSHVFVVPQKVLWRSLGLHKTFWGTSKKCENKNLLDFYFNINFLNAQEGKG